jgi:hypothetical protein
MFAQLSNLPQFPEECIREALTANYTQTFDPDQLRAFSSFNNTNFVKEMESRFGKCGGLYMKNLPMSYYDWHIDLRRQCSINWLICNQEGKAFYRKKVNVKQGVKSITYRITKVEYSLYKPTILDVTKEHCVINDNDQERIIFSMSVDAPFDKVYAYLSSLNIEKY